MKILAHAGRTAPDATANTMVSLNEAVASGCHGVEVDVRITRDKHLVLFHDRFAPGGQIVENLSHRALNEQASFPVPTLEEAVSAFPGIHWNLEIKTAAVARELQERWHNSLPPGTVLSSFLHESALSLTELQTCRVALLCGHRPPDIAAFVRSYSAFPGTHANIGFFWDIEFIDQNFLDECNAQGVYNGAYNVTMHDLADITHWEGLEYVIVDHFTDSAQ